MDTRKLVTTAYIIFIANALDKQIRTSMVYMIMPFYTCEWAPCMLKSCSEGAGSTTSAHSHVLWRLHGLHEHTDGNGALALQPI
jgi:hypothetical protein